MTRTAINGELVKIGLSKVGRGLLWIWGPYQHGAQRLVLAGEPSFVSPTERNRIWRTCWALTIVVVAIVVIAYLTI